MTKLIQTFAVFASLVCAANCWADEKALFVKYECSAGEKPGSPQYKLLVQGDHYRIEKNSAALPKAQMQRVAKVVLTTDQQAQLKKLVPSLAAAKIVQPDIAYLAGICSWTVQADGNRADATFWNVSALKPEFSDFMKWILSLEAKDQDGNQIHPVIPGEKVPPYP